MEAITFTEARNNLAKHLDRVVNDSNITIIRRRRGKAAVLMSLAEYESWKETMHLLRGKNAMRLLKSVDDINKSLRLKQGDAAYE